MKNNIKPVFNNSADGVPEIILIGDIGNYNAEFIADQIGNLGLKVGKEFDFIRMNINTFGGNIYSAFTIISAMNQFYLSGGEIETINSGRADSSGGWVFSFGTRGRRKMLQFAGMFLHEPMFGNGIAIKDLPENSEDRKMLENEFEKLIDIFTASTGISRERIKALMSGNTDLSADQAVAQGFADTKVLISNAPNIKNGVSRQEIVNITSNLTFDVIGENKETDTKIESKPVLKMSKLATLLNLNSEASENSIEQEVQKIMNQRTEAQTKLSEERLEHTATKSKLETAKAERDSAQSDLATIQNQNVTEYVDGLIAEDASLKDGRESLLNMAKLDFDQFKKFKPLKGSLVVNLKEIDDDAEEDANKDGQETEELKLAKEFHNMSLSARNELKNSDKSKYSKLVRAYDLNADKVFA